MPDQEFMDSLRNKINPDNNPNTPLIRVPLYVLTKIESREHDLIFSVIGAFSHMELARDCVDKDIGHPIVFSECEGAKHKMWQYGEGDKQYILDQVLLDKPVQE